MVRVYDRPLLRSSARADGALTANSDRFAIGLRKPGCEHPGYAAAGLAVRDRVLLHSRLVGVNGHDFIANVHKNPCVSVALLHNF